MIIAILGKTGVLDAWGKYDHDDQVVAESLQNFIICIEMLLFAIAHYFIFSHKPYIDPAAAQVPCVASCLRMLDVRDVAGDMKEHFVDPIPRPSLPRLGSKQRVSSSEAAPLLTSEGPGYESDSQTLVGSKEMSASIAVVTHHELRSEENSCSGQRSGSDSKQTVESDSDSTPRSSPPSEEDHSSNGSDSDSLRVRTSHEPS